MELPNRLLHPLPRAPVREAPAVVAQHLQHQIVAADKIAGRRVENAWAGADGRPYCFGSALVARARLVEHRPPRIRARSSLLEKSDDDAPALGHVGLRIRRRRQPVV